MAMVTTVSTIGPLPLHGLSEHHYGHSSRRRRRAAKTTAMSDFNCHQPLARARTIDLIGRNEKALHGITVVGGTILAGATTRHADVAVGDSFQSLF
jgi:hypothetical protein